jgi:hypothetical protein
VNDAWLDLMSAAGSTPYLDGAVCRGRHSVFDVNEHADPDRIEYAVHQCRGCPALTAGAAWVASLPPKQRPSGVVAGVLYGDAGRALPLPYAEAA